jgi:hypothetical protein
VSKKRTAPKGPEHRSNTLIAAVRKGGLGIVFLTPTRADLRKLWDEKRPIVAARVVFSRRGTLTTSEFVRWWISTPLKSYKCHCLTQVAHGKISTFLSLSVVPQECHGAIFRAAREFIETSPDIPRDHPRVPKGLFRTHEAHAKPALPRQRPSGSVQSVSQAHNSDRSWRGFRI